MKREYKSPEVEIEKFEVCDSRVFTVTQSQEGGFEGGDSGEEW